MTATPYQNPYGPPPAQPRRPPADAGARLRLIAGIVGAVAAVVVLAGSFLPQTKFEQVVGGKTESSQTISAWTRSFDVEPGDDAKKFYENTHVARYGIPLSAGALVLLAGAGLAFAGARRSAGTGVRSGARTALVAGGAGVAAAVWMLGMDVSATLSYESADGTVTSRYSTGLGFWILLGGGALGVVTLVLAALAGRQAPSGPAGPPPGPYGRPYQQQSRPYPGPPQQYAGAQPYPGAQPHPGGPPAQPYPGAPPSQPFPAQGGPVSQPFPAQGGPVSQPFPAQPGEAEQPSEPSSQPFPAQSGALSSRLDDPFGGATQAQPHPSQQEPPTSPTEPNYQLPPLNPPNT
ncbi:hypothetical protein QRX60_26105 [Amycolatopsis mongoliensis]|uniref:Uncharacterized protein n=1 Tax=Amycolatopsis mongoliensis TaxID=715475 RepID=A0A9Y2JYS9_9PSEU|nr:hypothetical protein [Amycolatopsis sp. 4-36]WIY07160.1 hypothetical protein QRX60_26105 [Amycolatopsis sp. 4-36]